MAGVILGLGTNIGDRSANLRRAQREVSRCVRISAVSRTFETEPVGYADQPKFLNMAVRGSTSLPPRELMLRLKEIERDMGREPTFRNGPRLIDIDVLFYDELVMEADDVVIPHPRAMEREFVLRPVLDVAPDLVDPRSGQRVDAALERLMNDTQEERIAEWVDPHTRTAGPQS